MPSKTFINLGAETNVNVHDGVGNPITSTDEAGSTALDVHVTGGDIIIENASITVDLDAQDGDNVAIHNSTTGDEWLINPGGAADVRVANTVAVTGPLTDAQLRATPVPVSLASIPLATGAATEAKQDAGNASLASIDGKITTTANGIRVDAVISDGAGPITVDGIVTANQGTSPWVISIDQTGNNNAVDVLTLPSVTLASQANPFTSALPISAAALPLPTGAATLAEQIIQSASLSVLDDWDEGDRAKVNPIVGQAGVAAGTGVDSVTTQRVSLATNVPLPVGDNVIGKVHGTQANNATPDNPVLVSGFDYTIGLQRSIRVTSQGRLDVGVNSSALPSGASTLAEQQTQTTSLQLLDDAVFTDNAPFTDNSSKVMAVGHLFDEVAGTALTENDIAMARIDSKRATVMVIEDANNRGTRTTVASPTADGIASTLFVALATTANAYVFNPAAGTWDRQRGNSTTGIFAGGAIAHDGVDSGNPLKIGGKASDAIVTAVANNDRTDAIFDRVGRQVTKPVCQRALMGVQTTTITLSGAETTFITGVASEAHDLLSLIIGVTALAVGGTVALKDSTGGTTRILIPLTAVGNIIIIPFGSVPFPQVAGANQNWTATISNATTTLTITAQYSKENTNS